MKRRFRCTTCAGKYITLAGLVAAIFLFGSLGVLKDRDGFGLYVAALIGAVFSLAVIVIGIVVMVKGFMNVLTDDGEARCKIQAEAGDNEDLTDSTDSGLN